MRMYTKSLANDHILITALLFKIIYHLTKNQIWGWLTIITFVIFVIKCIKYLWAYLKK